MQNAPARGRTLLLKYIVIEAMVTYFAVLNNNRYGWVSQSLLHGGHPLDFNRGPGQEAMPLSLEPSQTVRDNVIRVLYTLAPDSQSRGAGLALLQGVKDTPLGLILGTGKLHRYHDVPSGRVGV